MEETENPYLRVGISLNIFIMKKKFFLLMILIVCLALFSFGGGKGKGNFGGGTGGTTCNTQTVKLQLNQGNINFSKITDRDYSFYSFWPVSNILNGGQLKSATSLYDDIHNKNYCFVTITAIGCNSYGNGGTKTYLWDGSNDGNSQGWDMNIEVPSNKSFTISIDLHESCGDYYSGNNYKRAMWVHQQTYSPGAGLINISTWMFNRLSNC